MKLPRGKSPRRIHHVAGGWQVKTKHLPHQEIATLAMVVPFAPPLLCDQAGKLNVCQGHSNKVA